MKIAGLIGGIGPESTVAYYRQLIAAYRQRTQDGGQPSLIIDSIDLEKMLGLAAEEDLEPLTAYLLAEVRRLAHAGADFGALAASTPHLVFDELRDRSPIPLVSLVEAACRAARRMGLCRVGLLGTRFTMRGRFFPAAFERAGISLVVPAPAEQEYVHDRYMSQLVRGVFLDETRDAMLAIGRRLREEEAIDGLVLGGTELPLLLSSPTADGIPVLDTTALHVAEIVDEILA
jgi:aspartate racemase